ncbi:GntR family transcriptional regulator [Corynebacterium sp.]|uniref:GntR family transcriptional regulator n=1 Tax=Corynebacterium sp. TaxID=1720 RepID=UPI003B3B520E
MADEIVAGVLATAGPRVGGRDYSTRRIALMTGLSQPVVSRAMRRLRGGTAGGDTVPVSGGLWITGFRVEYPRVTLLFEEYPGTQSAGDEVGHQGVRSGERQSSERRATSVMAALRVAGVSGWPQSQASFDAGDESLPAGVVRVMWEPGGQSWDGFLGQLSAVLDACVPTVDAIPGDLLAQVSVAVGHGLHGLQWERADTAAPGALRRKNVPDSDSNYLSLAEYPPPSNARTGATPRHLQNEISVTEQIAIALRKEIMNAGFRPGDRVTSTRLANHMEIPVSTVRAAMRRMVDDGLLTASGGAFALPLVTGSDIIDLYAARLQVGQVLLRACSGRTRQQMLAPQLALRAVVAAAEHGTASDVDQADLHFQQTLADASGLPQSSRVFHALTLRLRMFISVLQLDYTPAVQRIVGDDRYILNALLSGKVDGALRVWRAKLDNAVRHMVHVSPTTFDPALWERLVGEVSRA